MEPILDEADLNDAELYDAELYELTHCGNEGDKEFYARLGGPGRDVLELGCGAGRVGMPMLCSGVRYVGLDDHPGMLDRFAAKLAANKELARRAELVRARMQNFRLDRKFDLIIAPYNVLFCLLTKKDLVDCLETVHAHLGAGGRFAFDVYHLLEDEVEEEGIEDDDEPEIIAHLTDGIRAIDVLEMDFVDWKNRRIDARYIYCIQEGDRLIEKAYTIEHRFWLRGELESVLRKVGFAVDEAYGDFFDDRLEPESEQLAVVAKKA